MTANDKSAANRALLSGTARGYNQTTKTGVRNGEPRPLADRPTITGIPGGMLRREMTDQPAPEPPPLPPALLAVWPIIVVGALGWLVAVAAAFLVSGLEAWRPVTLAGLGVGVLGTSIFVWQLAAARRGARGAQAGLETLLDHQ